MKDSVGKWFKDGAKDLNVIPPYEAWENVEKTIEDWPKHWYQSNAAGINNPADGAGWDNLAQQLEIRRNQKIGSRNFIARTASIVAALVFLPLWLMNVNPPTPIDNNLQEVTGEYDNSQTLLTATNIPNSNATRTTKANQTNVSSAFIASNETISSDVFETLMEHSTSVEPDLIELKTMKTREATLSSLQKTSILALATVSPISENAILFNSSKEITEPNDSKWSIAQTAIFGSSALVNPLSFRDDVNTASSFNISYGLSVSRRFHKNQFTGDLLFNDVKSQIVSLNSEEVQTQLSGITLALQYERIVPIFKNAKRLQPELNFGAGVFGSYLNNASVMSNSNDSYFSSFTYRNADFGGVLSISSSIKIGQKLRFNVGARVQAGAVNLFEGKEKVPSKLFRTQSLFTGVQAKLSYTL